jgi:ketosteroid isomerase-like protein
MTSQDQRAWADFFRAARRLTAEFSIVEFHTGGAAATAQVRALYRYVEAANGPPQELRQRLEMRFTKASVGWRIAGMDEVR